MPTLATEGLPDDPDDREQLRALETAIRKCVNPTLSRTLNGTYDDDIYLSTSWLGAIHCHVRRRQGDPRRSTAQWDRQQYLAAICNRLELNYQDVLEADSIEELRLLRDGLRM